MEIKLDTDTIKNLISEAIMTSLTAEKRDALIQEALGYLLTQTKREYDGRAQSPLERAFRSSLDDIAKEIAAEALAKDTRVREVIRKLISEGVEKLLDEKGYNETVERIRSAIARGFDR